MFRGYKKLKVLSNKALVARNIAVASVRFGLSRKCFGLQPHQNYNIPAGERYACSFEFDACGERYRAMISNPSYPIAGDLLFEIYGSDGWMAIEFALRRSPGRLEFRESRRVHLTVPDDCDPEPSINAEVELIWSKGFH
jgi:hypothetical protein